MENGSVAAFYEDYSLYWYGIVIAAAIFLGVVASMVMRKIQRERVNDVLFAAVFSIPLGIMGARAYYCWHGERNIDLSQLFRPGAYLDGGFALYGALGMGLIASLVVCIILRINIPRFLDSCAPALSLGIGAGRLAAHFSAIDRGSAVSAAFLQKHPFSTWIASDGEWILNVYFFEAVTAFLIFLFLFCLFVLKYRTAHFKCRSGDIALCFMFLYGLSQCFFEPLRTDALFWHSTAVSRLHFVMISQAVSAVIAAVSLSIFILRFIYKRGINIFSVLWVIISALGFSLIFSQEIRLPLKSQSLIITACAVGSSVLIVMGLALVFMQSGDIDKAPAAPWMLPQFWIDKIRSKLSSVREKERVS